MKEIIKINETEYKIAESEKEMINSLFKRGGTCDGYINKKGKIIICGNKK